MQPGADQPQPGRRGHDGGGLGGLGRGGRHHRPGEGHTVKVATKLRGDMLHVAVAPRAQHQPGLRAHLRGLGPGRRQGQHTEGGRGAVRQGGRGQDDEGQLTRVHMGGYYTGCT